MADVPGAATAGPVATSRRSLAVVAVFVAFAAILVRVAWISDDAIGLELVL